MSTRIVISEVKLDEDQTSKEVAEAMNERLAYYASNHPEFAYQIEENRDKNKITVKTVTLDGNAN